MIKKSFIFVSINLTLIGGAIFFYYGVNAFEDSVSASLEPTSQVIGTNVSVSTDWKEIVPESPIKVEKQIQTLFLVVDGYERDLKSNNNDQIKASDETFFRTEIQILDEFGNVYDMHASSRTGDMIGFIPDTENLFSADRTYTKIRIRSDKPFHFSKIIWMNDNIK